MRIEWGSRVLIGAIFVGAGTAGCSGQAAVPLPDGVTAVWDMDRALRETTPTRERICINGLWHWQPGTPDAEDVPQGNWGWFKVPGSWPGITDYMQKDCQSIFAHPSWADDNLGGVKAAWYERKVSVPADWAGRRIALSAEYVNSYAAVYVDGEHVASIHFPAGEVDITDACRPGTEHDIALLVVPMPLKGVMLSYNDTASAREVQGSVARRGLCGDVFLEATPTGSRVTGVRADTSVRREEITFHVTVEGLAADAQYALRARVSEGDRTVRETTGAPFAAADLADGQASFTEKWLPEKLWDTHTPENQYDLTVSLLDAVGEALDTTYPQRTGFREFWIDGRDFYLNGTRIYLSAVPLDNAQVGAAWASYDGGRESLLRLQSYGINFVYTHNYGCEPGSHLGFTELLRAADDVGMLVGLSQPHFGHYDWKADDADQSNGYARHAEFYAGVAALHPSIVTYSMSHNGTGYSEDMNPDLIDGVHDPRDEWSMNNVRLALRAEAIVSRLDPSRIVYHHSSGNLSSMHTVNFYPNFVPIQEMSDWFEHWATEGRKPVFLCEYGAPFSWDWTMYRGWYKGNRSFGSATVPWEYCLAEWNAQFHGDTAFDITEKEKENLRWEAAQFKAGNLWHRWDYPYQVGSREFDERHAVMGEYIADNWRAHRTWGLSANSPWEHGHFWRLREGADTSRRELPVDWAALQRPGFSADYLDERYERMDLAFEKEDWVATAPAQALLRNNMPLLAYIGGSPEHFTEKGHNVTAGEAVEKQLILINNSREPVTADCEWALNLPEPMTGRKTVALPTGEQERIPLELPLPADLPPGEYELSASVDFGDGGTQADTFALHVIPAPQEVGPVGKVALFDPQGETAETLDRLGRTFEAVGAEADLSSYEVLVVGKGALTVEGPAPDISRVREGLKVVMFEQTAEALEKRLGLRVVEYGLREVFPRVPDHPLLAGVNAENLRDWRGEATLVPPQLDYEPSGAFNGVPGVRWAGIEVPRLWRCGCWGNVASVLIEKPARGDFLPVVDGGYSLQYSPLVEYREGAGVVLLCQLDVTGRTEADPVAETLARNLLSYVSAWEPTPRRDALYTGGQDGLRHLEHAGIDAKAYSGGAIPPDSVLVVGSGGGQEFTAHATAVADFLKVDGNLLALGLDGQEADALLPFEVEMTQAEHIACLFEPGGVGSLLQGVGPADVHNRAPRELPLMTGGATVVGDGVLANAEDANVVFCQLPPYEVTRSQGMLPSFVVDDADAVEATKSALVTLGAASGKGGQFGQKVDVKPEVGSTYTFAAFVKGLGGPATLRLEVERAGRPWDRAVKGDDTPVPEGEWTELHVTFRADTPFDEGWQAYIACTQDGGVFRADMLRLHEGDYTPWQAKAGPANLMQNPGFETGEQPWFYNFEEQQNLRRTFRRTSFLLARLLANMGVAARTPLLERFSTPVGGPAGESLVSNGDFGQDDDGDGAADGWSVSGSQGAFTATREELGEGWCQRVELTDLGPEGKNSVMLARHDVPAEAGQWYRLALRARAEDFGNGRVTLTLTNTEVWHALFEYQRFAPTDEWQEFEFLVQSDETKDTNTRFQIWHGNLGTLWLADVSMTPISDPTEGRWASGFYLDQPTEWDDPYRFFRW